MLALLVGAAAPAAAAPAAPAPAAAAGPSCFTGDYPKLQLPKLDYRKAFAGSAIAPARILVGGRALTAGLSVAQIDAVLGGRSSVVSGWQPRGLEEQCRYTLEVLRRAPHSMNVYRWMDLRKRRLAGEFQIRVWRLGKLGSVRVFLHRRAGWDAARAWLFHVLLTPVPVASVPYRYKPGLHLVREGPPRIEWNLATDALTLPAAAE